jgi:hypothetical protein
MAVLAGCEIDSAKKEFPVNVWKEISKIKKALNETYKEEIDKYNCGKSEEDKVTDIKPFFMGEVAKAKGQKKSKSTYYKKFNTFMDYYQSCLKSSTRCFFKDDVKGALSIEDLLDMDEYKNNEENRHRIPQLLEIVDKASKDIAKIYKNPKMNKTYKNGLINWHRQQLVDEISKTELNKSTIIGLLCSIDETNEDGKFNDKNGLLLQVLLDIPKLNVMQYFKKRNAVLSDDERRNEYECAVRELYDIYGLHKKDI